MAKQNENLFEESSQGAVSAVTAVAFVFAFILVFGGMILMSYGFGSGAENTDLTIFTFGLAATFLGMFVPFGLLSMTGK